MLSGRVAVVKAFGTPEQQIVRVHGPGRFLGELGLLTGQVAFFTAIVAGPRRGARGARPTGCASACCGIPRSATRSCAPT